ncbi:dienelactone hydrolase family protein [Glycomyces sp. L485]|nr:alpha/beta family hydrolase [Glycomyces sp. L485]MCH7229850.1 dienelactone hydrolase family protein [Glycomyces sp. L485]
MTDETLKIPAGPVELEGHLAVPGDAAGVVVFAHGSGSSRHSRRNQYVARTLNEAGLGTLLFDLLTPAEGDDRAKVFDIALLAGRLAEVTSWLQSRPSPETEWIGYFGASTGAAAALRAATAPGIEVRTVVSRGGRPDLAAEDLPNVRTPTLLIVGERDEEVLGLNYAAQRLLGGPSRIAIVPGATHLFEEPGALDSVAQLARDWFNEHLGPA